MSRPLVRDTQAGSAGGLNLTGDDALFEPTEMRKLTNARLVAGGSCQRRRGSRRLHVSAMGSGAIVRGLYAWRKPASQELLALSNGALQVGAYAMPMTWTAKTGAFASTVVPSFAPFRDGSGEVCYVADGGLLNKYDGSAVTVDIASTGAPARLAVYNQRLFAVGGTDQTVMWSAINNGDTLNIAGSAGGSAVVRTFGNQKLTALAALGGSLLLWHVTGVSRFTGMTQDDIAIAAGAQGVSGSEGTIAPNSIVVVALESGQDVAFFLTTRGLFVATEGGVTPVSLQIEQALSQLDQTSWARVQAGHHRQYGEVWFYLPDVGVYAWNYRVKAWSGPYTGDYITHLTYAMTDALDSQSRPILLTGHDDGFVRQADYPATFVDDVLAGGTGGATYTMEAQYRRLFFGDPTQEKAVRCAYVTGNLHGSTTAALLAETQTMTEQMTIAGTGTAAADTWDDGSVWDADGTTWDGSAALSQTIPVPVSVRGQYVDFTVVDDGAYEPELAMVSADAFTLNRRFS